MRDVRIYQEGYCPIGQELALTPEASQHVAVVLRMQVGEALILFNGTNCEFLAHISDIKKKQVIVTIKEALEISRESPLMIHLGQAISKGDRMEWAIQKAVELGVYRITPLITERCVVKLDKERMLKKVQQWRSIAIAACEQCGRNIIPTIDEPQNLMPFLSACDMELKWILHTSGNKTWRDYKINTTKIALLIGPEGGFSEHEVQLAESRQFMPLSLGPRILRTETATISALSLLQAVSGDL